MWIFKKHKFQLGQTIIELVLAMGIAAIIFPTLLSGFMSTREGRPQQEKRLQAIALLKETEAAVKSFRENDWTAFASITHDTAYHPEISGTEWVLVSGTQTNNDLTQSVVMSDVNRNANGDIVTSGGTNDPSTKRIIITISWTKPQVSNVTSTSYYTRTTNLTYSESSKTQLDLGTPTNTQVTEDLGGEIKLANNNKGKWCSPAFSSSSIDLPDGPPVAVAAQASSTSITTPNDVFVATAPNTSNIKKLSYLTVTADADPPTATLQGSFTLDSSQYSPGTYPSVLGNPPTIANLDNNFKTNDITYYKSAASKLYALLATNLSDKEVVVVQINDGSGDAFQDSVNKIYKYWTFFNTNIYTNATSNTGFLDPSANSAESSSSGDNNGFQSNSTRAYSNNSSFAVDTDSGSNTGIDCAGSDKDRHRFYNYDISLPTGAAINGIEVRLDAKVDSTTGSPKMCVQLSWDGGVTWTTTKSTSNLTTNEATYTLGGSADTWGRSWSTGDFSNSNFRLRVTNIASNISRDFSLDWAAVKIYHTANDYAPYDYGASSITTLGTKGYVSSGGYLYVFDLSNIDSKSPTSGLDMIGCRIELDGYDCSTGSMKKYSQGETGGTWSTSRSAVHPDCSDGGNIELYATNDIYPVSVSGSNYIYAAVGGGTDPELNIINATNIPDGSSSPAISNSSCGRSSGGNAAWKRVGSYDFNSNGGTEEAANSVFAKSDGERAYITSNGGADSKQYYIINTHTKSSPAFLSGSSASGPSSGYYNGASPAPSADTELYPRRAMTVQNGARAVLVGKDGISNGNNAEEYQVLDNSTEATPTYCGGLNYDIGFNDLTSVSELDGDNYVYMVANTTSNELKIIQGGPDNAVYVASGSYESKIFDTNSVSLPEAAFNHFSSNITQPAGTSIQVQVASAPAVSGSCTGANFSYVGPDGDSAQYFTPSGSLLSGIIPFGNYLSSAYQNPSRCFRYKALLSTTDQTQTPVIYDFTANYSP